MIVANNLKIKSKIYLNKFLLTVQMIVVNNLKIKNKIK
jgi:hypothetical protein